MESRKQVPEHFTLRIAIILVGLVGLLIVASSRDTYMPEIKDTNIHQKVRPDVKKNPATKPVATLHSETPQCHVCHKNDKVIPIIYGRPNQELVEREKNGEVKLAGCVLVEDAAYWYCKRDDSKLSSS